MFIFFLRSAGVLMDMHAVTSVPYESRSLRDDCQLATASGAAVRAGIPLGRSISRSGAARSLYGYADSVV